MRHRFPIIAAALALLLCTTIVLAQAPTAPPKPGPEVKKMASFVGNWTSTIEMKPVPGMSPGGKATATRSCVWPVGGFGVSCKQAMDMGAMGKVTSNSLMAYDAEAKNYIYSEVSSTGEAFSVRGVANGDTWVFDNDATMQGKMMHGRFTATFSNDTVTIKFEMGPDANSLQTVMEGKEMRKAAAPAASKPPAK